MTKWFNTGMIRSLLVKVAMLAVTAGLVFWIGWSVPDSRPVSSHGAIAEPLYVEPATHVPLIVAVPHQLTDVPDRTDRFRPKKPAASSKPRDPLDLNRASVEDLQQLPGVGEVLAMRIIDHRKTTGSFKMVDDLLEVKGIGKKRLEKLRMFLVVKSNRRPAIGEGKKL